MRTIGFPISRKEHENRRAILPHHLKNVKNKSQIYIEKGFGEVLGYSDEAYLEAGVNVVSFEEILEKDIICDPKIGDAPYLEDLEDKVLFGWVHLVQNRDITDAVLKGKNTTYTWEDMNYMGRHEFWHNNKIAGIAGVQSAFLEMGYLPYGKKVAVIGKGNTASGAIEYLSQAGADVTIYSRRTEKLLKKEMFDYDVIVNCILWDTSRKDHIIYKEDLKKFKGNTLFIDISCDRAGAIESSIPTKISDPIYIVDGVTHYVVDHTPSLLFRESSEGISKVVSKYIDELVEDFPSKVLLDALAIEKGKILDQRIIDFQGRDSE